MSGVEYGWFGSGGGSGVEHYSLNIDMYICFWTLLNLRRGIIFKRNSISVTIEGGQRVGIIGRTGSGKFSNIIGHLQVYI